MTTFGESRRTGNQRRREDNNRTLRLAQINLARSPEALEDLHSYIRATNTDIIFISEPPAILRQSQLIPAHYHWIHLPDEDISGAGILYHQKLRTKSAPQQNTRVASLIVEGLGQQILLCSVYFQPESLEGLEEAECVLEKAKSSNLPVIMGGDMNGHSCLWSPAEENRSGERLNELIMTRDLVVGNDPDSEPTFVRADTQQWLDVTLTSPELAEDIYNWAVDTSSIPNSDHHLIRFEYQGLSPLKTMDLRKWHWGSTDWQEFRELLPVFLNTKTDSHLSTAEDIERAAEHITQALQATRNLLVRRSDSQPYRREWFDAEARSLHQQLKQTPRGSTEFTQLRKDWKRLMSKKKSESFQRFLASTNSLNCWDVLKRLSNRQRTPRLERLQVGGEEVTEGATIAENLARHYFPDYQCEEDRTRASNHTPIWNEDQDAPADWIYVREWSLDEVCEALKRPRRSTAPGEDQIPYLAIRACADILAEPLKLLFNAILQTGHYPRCWKKGRVCNILKPQKAGDSPTHFRPITLLNCLSKVLERLLTERATQWAERNKVLPPEQHGFRRGRDCREPLRTLTDSIWTALNRRHKLTAISLDFRGAYDRVSPEKLCERLSQNKIPSRLGAVIWSFLQDRTAAIQVQGEEYKFQPVRGLPQGSSLSPLLYVLYSSNIPQYLPPSVKHLMYADDVILYQEHSNGGEEASLQSALDGIQSWCHENFMQLNEEKTQMTTFRRIHDAASPNLSLGSHRLAHQDNLKYLGILFDRSMTFEAHVREKILQATRRLLGIRRMSRRLWGSSAYILRKLYLSCVQPLVTYGSSESWVTGLNAQGREDRVDRITRLAALAITGLDQTTSLETASALAHLVPLSSVVRQQLLENAQRVFKSAQELEQPVEHLTHCTPTTLLRADLHLLWKHRHRHQSGSRHLAPKPPAEALWSLVKQKQKTFRWIVRMYTFEIQDRQWLLSNKSQELKRIGWERRSLLRPWFVHHSWQKQYTTQVNRILSGHVPTLDYLKSKGKLLPDIQCRLCHQYPETRDHLFNCPSLRQERITCFRQDEIPLNDVGSLLQVTQLYFSFARYCMACHQRILSVPIDPLTTTTS